MMFSLLIRNIKLLSVLFFRIVQKLFYVFPVHKDKVLILNYHRKGVCCNPKYILEHLLQRGEVCKLLWATSYPETCATLKERGVPVIKAYGLSFFYHYLTASVLVTNDCFPPCLSKRKGQLFIYTWHGLAYKRLGLCIDYKRNLYNQLSFEYAHDKADIFLVPSRVDAANMGKAFALSPAVMRLWGYPRNDVFFDNTEPVVSKVRAFLQAAPGLKLALYAPTFRGLGSGTGQMFGLDVPRLLNALSTRFGGKWILLFRSHYFLEFTEIEQPNIMDVTLYPDMQELLVAADVLLTDYSSCIADFSLSGKPSFLYTRDLFRYRRRDRDFFIPIKEWPYPLAESNGELEQNILRFDAESYAQALEKHHSAIGLYKGGNSSQLVCDTIISHCIRDYPNDKTYT